MGSGFAGRRDLIITIENLKKLLPEETKAIDEFLERKQLDWDEFCQALHYGGDLEVEDESGNPVPYAELECQFLALNERFHALTETDGGCLNLEPAYHDKENRGDRYDEVDGGFFCVDGAYQQTAAGKKFDEYLAWASWVTFG